MDRDTVGTDTRQISPEIGNNIQRVDHHMERTIRWKSSKEMIPKTFVYDIGTCKCNSIENKFIREVMIFHQPVCHLI